MYKLWYSMDCGKFFAKRIHNRSCLQYMMKKWIPAIVISCGLLVLSACNNNSENIVESKSGNITKEEFYETLKDRYGEGTLQELVYKKVLDDKYDISKEEIDELVNDFKTAYGDSFSYFLSSMGIADEDELREVLEFQLLQQRPAMDKITVTEDELKEQYEIESKIVTARHILVEDEKVAKEVLDKLNAGEKFEDLAKKYSEDTGTASKGGDLGELNPNMLDRDFVKGAFSLKENEISEPVKSQYGYHIIQATKVEAKKDVKPLEEMKDSLERKVKRSKLDDTKVQEALQEIMKEANIKVNDSDLKDLFKTK